MIDYASTMADGLCDSLNQRILIDTDSNHKDILCSLIHEIGHALNFIIQSQAQDVGRHAITGGQVNKFFANKFFEKQGVDFFPSGYGGTHELEWFADAFERYMLEQAGRWDLIMHETGRNALMDSYYLTDPSMYLALDKVVHVINHRNQDPKSFDLLMQVGLDARLFRAAEGFGLQNQGLYYQVSFEARLSPDRVPSALKTLLNKWHNQPLERILAQAPKPQKDDFDYEKTALDHFNRSDDPEVQNMYLNPGVAERDMTPYMSHPDFYAIYLVCRMKQATTWMEKVDVMIRFGGVTTDEQLSGWLDSLRVLDRQAVEDIINPTYVDEKGVTRDLMGSVLKEVAFREGQG